MAKTNRTASQSGKNTKPEKDLQEITVWRDRIERGKKLRAGRIKEAKKYINYYKSNQWEQNSNWKERPVINLIFATIKSQLPFLYFKNPKWYVTPKSGHEEEKEKIQKNAKTAEIYLNYYANENLRITLKRQTRLAILDAFFIFGCLKTGYVSNMIINENYGKPKILGYNGEDAIYDIDDKGNVQIDEREEVILNEKFVSRRVSPAFLIFDTECLNYFDDGRYIIEEISIPIQDIKNDKKYENTSDLKPTYMVKRGMSLSDQEMGKSEYSELQEDLKRTTIYEIWDIEHDKLKVIAEGHDKWLRNEITPAGIESHPYTFLQYNDIPDEIYPLSDIRVLKSPQDEYNKSRAMVITHAKRYARKYGYIEGMIDEDELTKVEAGEDGTMFKVKELPLSKVIEPLEDAALDTSVYTNLDQARGDFDRLAVTNEADRGVIERRKTAYEASKIYGSSDLRKEDRRALIEDFMAETGDKLLQSMQANLSPQDAVPIAGKNRALDWMAIDKTNLEGQFTVKVEIGSMSAKLPESERQEFIMFMQSLSQFPPDMIQRKVNIDKLLEAVPLMFPALEDINLLNTPEQQKAIEDQQAKEQQIKMMLELAKMRGGKLQLSPEKQQGEQQEGK